MMTMNAFGSFSWHVFILFVTVLRDPEEETFCTKHLMLVVVEKMVVLITDRCQDRCYSTLPLRPL